MLTDLVNSPSFAITLLVPIFFFSTTTLVILMHRQLRTIGQIRHRLRLLLNQRNIESSDGPKRLSNRDIIISDLAALADSYKDEINNLWLQLEDIRQNQTPIFNILSQGSKKDGLQNSLNIVCGTLALKWAAVIKTGDSSPEQAEVMAESARVDFDLPKFILSPNFDCRTLGDPDSGQINDIGLAPDSGFESLRIIPLGSQMGNGYYLVGAPEKGCSTAVGLEDGIKTLTKALSIKINEYEESEELRSEAAICRRSLSLRNSILSEGTPDDILARFSDLCCEIFGFNNCAIYHWDVANSLWHRRAFAGADLLGLRWDQPPHEAMEYLRQNNQANFHQIQTEDDIETLYALRNSNGLQGVMRLASDHPIDNSDALIIEECAGHLTTILQKSQDFERIENKLEISSKSLRDRMKELGALERISEGILRATDLNAVLDVLTEHLGSPVDNYSAYWLKLDDAASRISIYGRDANSQFLHFSEGIWDEFWLKALMEGTDIYEGYPAEGREDQGELLRFFAARGLGYIALLPLHYAEASQVILALGKKLPVGLSPLEYRLLMRLRSHLQLIARKFMGDLDDNQPCPESPTSGEKIELVTPHCQDHQQTMDTSPVKILVVDDDEYVRDILQTLLTSKGHNVELADDGNEGICKFKKGHHDVVITDLEMPGISGWDVAKKIKSIAPKTKIVLATGWGTQCDGEDFQSKGVDLMLSKPFDMRVILSMVSNAKSPVKKPLE